MCVHCRVTERKSMTAVYKVTAVHLTALHRTCSIQYHPANAILNHSSTFAEHVQRGRARAREDTDTVDAHRMT